MESAWLGSRSIAAIGTVSPPTLRSAANVLRNVAQQLVLGMAHMESY